MFWGSIQDHVEMEIGERTGRHCIERREGGGKHKGESGVVGWLDDN